MQSPSQSAGVPIAAAAEILGSRSELDRLVREGRLRTLSDGAEVASSDLIRWLRRRRDADVERRLRDDLGGPKATAGDASGIEWLDDGEPADGRRRPLAAALITGGACASFCLRCPSDFCPACPVQQKVNRI